MVQPPQQEQLPPPTIPATQPLPDLLGSLFPTTASTTAPPPTSAAAPTAPEGQDDGFGDFGEFEATDEQEGAGEAGWADSAQFSSQQKPAATSKIPEDDPFAEIMGETDEKKDDVKK